MAQRSGLIGFIGVVLSAVMLWKLDPVSRFVTHSDQTLTAVRRKLNTMEQLGAHTIFTDTHRKLKGLEKWQILSKVFSTQLTETFDGPETLEFSSARPRDKDGYRVRCSDYATVLHGTCCSPLRCFPSPNFIYRVIHYFSGVGEAFFRRPRRRYHLLRLEQHSRC